MAIRENRREGATGMASAAHPGDTPAAKAVTAAAAGGRGGARVSIAGKPGDTFPRAGTAGGLGGSSPRADTVLGSLTIPGRPEHVREARDLVVKALGELHPDLDDAVLLTSELVTNAVVHSNSRCAGGTVRVVILELAAGVRIEVADEGSDLSTPVVRGEVFASAGHGLLLVQSLADQWGYLRDERGTTVWFWLSS
jgi:anti-sigma regulatory factor (Ser/Thr protein kinase)